MEIASVLVAGFGLGIALGAIFLPTASSQKTATQPAVKTTRSASAKGLPAASAGVQPGRTVGEEPASADQGRTALTAGSEASFARLASKMPGKVELAVEPLGGGSMQTLNGDLPAPGWSTTKVPVIAALVKARNGLGLNASELSEERAAITESSNEAILSLFDALQGQAGGFEPANDAIQEVLEEGGDERTEVASAPPPPGAVTTFGQTQWRPSEAVKFFAALAGGCLKLPTPETRHILELMQQIVPDQSWGLGSAGFAHVAFKDGWGPEHGRYLVRQSGIVEVGTSQAAAVTIVDFAPSFAAGQLALTETARWLHDHLRLTPHAQVSCPAGT